MSRAPLDTIRVWLLVTLGIGLIGTEVELLLLKHFDGFWQLVPTVAIGMSILILAWCVVAPGRAALRALQGMMVLFLGSGGVGAVQHYRGNIAYERDSDPSVGGLELYKRAAMGSTPSLAPGAMIQLGLIGLLFTYRHPRLGREELT